MTDPLKNLLKNTTIIYSAEIVNRIFLFVVVIYAARVFGVKLFGDYSYAATIFIFLQTFSDFGFTVFLTREVAHDNENRHKIFREALFLRIINTFILLVLFMIYLHTTTATRDVKFYILITGLSLIPSSYALNFILTLRGMNMMKMDSFIRVSGVFITAILTLISLNAGFGIPGIACAMSIGNFTTILIASWINKRYEIIQKPKVTKFEYLKIARNSLPFAIMAFLVTIYTRIDTLFLQHIKGATEVGLYHASFKVADAVLILPFAFSIVLLPVLSGFFAEANIEKTKTIAQLGFKYMTYIGIFLAVITFMLSDKIIEILYSSIEYKDAVLGLQIFSFVIIVIFISSIAGPLILSSKIAHINVWINFSMVILCIALNLILIPHLGFVGAATVRFIVETFGLTLNMLFVNKLLFPINYLADIKKPFLAGIILALFIYIVKSLLFLPIYFLLYVITLYLLRGISPTEFAFMKALVSERLKNS